MLCTGLHLERAAGAGLAEVAGEDPALALHAMLQHLPLSGVTTVAATVLVIAFFVTSSDSGSLVDDMVTSGGHPHPPRIQRVFWATAEGAVAATLPVAGGLQALRTASLTSVLPMTVFLIVAVFGLVRALRRDHAVEGVPSRRELRRRARTRSPGRAGGANPPAGVQMHQRRRPRGPAAATPPRRREAAVPGFPAHRDCQSHPSPGPRRGYVVAAMSHASPGT